MERYRQKTISALVENDHSEKRKPEIGSIIQAGFIDKSTNMRYGEFRCGLYFRNGNHFAGISTGIESTELETDTFIYTVRQIPIYISNILYLLKPENNTALVPYIRLDAGFSASRYSVYQNVNTDSRRNYNYDPANSSLLLNTGFGIKINPRRKTGGFILETGYKLMPSRIKALHRSDFVYVNLGMAF